jgi:hypothetical protein
LCTFARQRCPGDRAKLERRAGEIKRETGRLVNAITQGAHVDAIVPKLNA